MSKKICGVTEKNCGVAYILLVGKDEFWKLHHVTKHNLVATLNKACQI